MIDPGKLYFSSSRYRGLLEQIGEDIDKEEMADRSGDYLQASKHGLKAWRRLKQLMKMLRAHSLYELDEANVTLYDLLYWADCFATELHNASIQDKSLEAAKIAFCEEYTKMHHGMLAKRVRNLGNIRRCLAEAHYAKGNTQEADSLFEEWLGAEPDWGWGWIGWSDCYWLWNPGMEKDFAKAEEILTRGLCVPGVRDRQDIEERVSELRREKNKPTP
jgi:tetratricopeptide (TPR) repeat protein